MSNPLLTISIVTFGGDAEDLRPALRSAAAAAALWRVDRDAVHLVLVDNGPYNAERRLAFARLEEDWGGHTKHIFGHGNVGYGGGHNLAIAGANSQYHLVLNPDVELAGDALVKALAFMDAHPACGLLAPSVRDERGELQYLCKRYPTVLDLALRGFAPSWLRDIFHRRLAQYEMRDIINERDVVWDPPIISGCFMLFRMTLLRAVAGFDPRYFLYFEDFDLSLRSGHLARLAYVPEVRITHLGGDAARKGLSHIGMFAVSAARFFREHGWQCA
jgi:GT2 family glycosyltransferase